MLSATQGALIERLTPECPRVPNRKCTITQPPRHKRSNPQHKLLQSSDSSSNTRMRNLALINRNDHDKEAHAEPSNRPTAIQPLNGLRGRLEASANDEDETPNKNCPFTSDKVTDGTGEAGTEKGTSREERNGYTTGDLVFCSAFVVHSSGLEKLWAPTEFVRDRDLLTFERLLDC